MKRIINGSTYNTETSRRVGRWDYVDDRKRETSAFLYQTRGGAFFAIHAYSVTHFDGQEENQNRWEALSRSEAEALLHTANEFELYDTKVFVEPPEAVEQAAPEAILYTRIPASLKATLADLANQEGLSLNSWVMRCVEKCAGITPKDRNDPDLPDFGAGSSRN